jgi:hypothetical protein
MEKNKMYTYMKDESNKITDISVNGKPVKRGSMRGFKKAQNTSYWLFIGNDVIARNPFSGVEVALNSLEATIYGWCVDWYSRYERNVETEAPIQTYDDMKYCLLELNSNAYMDLID